MEEKNFKRYKHLIENIEQWPIYKFAQKRTEFVKKVSFEVFQYYASVSSDEIDQTLSKAIYQEKQRIKTNPWKADPANQAQFFRKLQNEYNENQLIKTKNKANLDTCFKLIKRYADEITGNFNVNTFRFVRKLSTIIFYGIFFRNGFLSFSSFTKRENKLQNKLKINGHIEEVRHLFNKHTFIFVPTHSSNLDSIIAGYTIDLIAGLPAFSYGAGLNLFDSEFFAFFMNRLGAYKVDRRKKNQIYLQTLNYYSKLSIIEGVNTIFFPGGTRSRSGEVEGKLKLGLLSSLILAQRDLLEVGSDRKIIVVPIVLTYESVLEARTLMLQHLRNSGQEKYTGRERASSFGKYIHFLKRLIGQESAFYMSFGKSIDVFGNEINELGESIDQHGNKLDLKHYFLRNNKIEYDTQREGIYTRELGEKIALQYKKYNYILPCHLVAFSAFQLLKQLNPGHDMVSLVQLPEDDFIFPNHAFKLTCEQVRTKLFAWADEGKIIYPDQLEGDISEIISKGITSLGIFHIKRPLTFDEFDRLVSDDFIALLYYHNKFENLNLAEEIDWHLILKDPGN
ncbi:MAG: 1-acyl-sn-glycerol-3-phosphate acyltransferase [Bacteroidota bacterium]|nr:1-acyl-sn-glycerol-3-phosphate acyltransferase [Bacteroidota bacterium]